MRQPLAFLIGVTGHRDLGEKNQPALKAAVRKIFTDLHTQYPHTSFLQLSPLAEGADRLVAEVVQRSVVLCAAVWVVAIHHRRESVVLSHGTVPVWEPLESGAADIVAVALRRVILRGFFAVNDEMSERFPGYSSRRAEHVVYVRNRPP